MKFDYYEKLEVSPDATDDEIKDAYRILAQLYHPDNHNRSSEKIKQMANKKFRDISEAYEILSDENSRYEYDEQKHSTQKRARKEYDLHEREYSDYSYQRYDQTSDNEQLHDAIKDARKSIPKVVKVLVVFTAILGWVLFVSYFHLSATQRAEIDNLYNDFLIRRTDLENARIDYANISMQVQHLYEHITRLTQERDQLEWINITQRDTITWYRDEKSRLLELLNERAVIIMELNMIIEELRNTTN